MTYYDNPAQRLLSIVNTMQTIPKQEPCRKAWHIILNDDSLTDFEIVLSISKIIELINQITDYFKAHDPEYLQNCDYWINQITPALGLSMRLYNSWGDVKDCIDDHTIRYLHSAVIIINSNIDKRQINHLQKINYDELSKISIQVKELHSEIFQAEIDEKIKLSILKYLSRLIEAIDNYAITGSEAILDAIEAALGHMLLNPDYRQFMTEDELGKKVMSNMGNIANFITVVTGIITLGKEIWNLLPK